jgi:hypothetical protein
MSMRAAIRWNPPEVLTPVERKIVRKLTRTGRLYAFLREVRHLLFDDAFQAKLAEAYKDAAKGRPPVPPALLMMVTLLQAYTGVSDAEAVHYALFDKRWQMVLDCMECEEAPFSQGLLAESRFRFIRHDLDRELIRRTVELAKETGKFGWKALRVALDSAPIWGAGRVEDTFNLIGHGLMVCVACAADVLGLDSDDVVSTAKLEIVGRSSVKAALDIDWDDAEAKRGALERLLGDVARFRTWLASQPKNVRPDNKAAYDALDAAMAQLDRLVDQDVEPDPEREGRHRIIDGTTEDRQISVGDAEMRHGRKSKSTTINGFKGHIALELDHELVLDGLAEPANKREHEAADTMRPNIEHFAPVVELHIDRGFLSAGWVTELDRAGVPVFSKPWNPSNHGLYPKSAFTIDMAAQTVTCPGGETASFPSKRGKDGRRQVAFTACPSCPLRPQCTTSERGRSIVLHEAEDFLQRLQAAKRTAEGRARLRERTTVEHGLAHVLQYAPHEARYLGSRKNTFALRRAGAIVNLQTTDRLAREAA